MTNKRKHSAGKGDTPRPVDKNRYDRNYECIFGVNTKEEHSQQKHPLGTIGQTNDGVPCTYVKFGKKK